MDIITIEDIQQMTPEEQVALNQKIVRKLAKTVLIKVAVGAAVIIVASLVEKKLDARWNDTTETPEED